MIGYHSGEAVTQESLGEKILRGHSFGGAGPT
jgi:hypothetical protein